MAGSLLYGLRLLFLSCIIRVSTCCTHPFDVTQGLQTKEAGGVVGWEAEDLGNGVVEKLGRRCRHGVLRSRAVVGGRNDLPGGFYFTRFVLVRCYGKQKLY